MIYETVREKVKGEFEAKKLYYDSEKFDEGWNFGPKEEDVKEQAKQTANILTGSKTCNIQLIQKSQIHLIPELLTQYQKASIHKSFLL